MRILLTNDDGVNAHGLEVLEQIARTLSDDIWVVAPETDQSGVSHSLSLNDPLRLREIASEMNLPSPRICEIGGGMGGAAYYAARLGAAHYTLIDLPVMNALQGYFLPASLVGMFGYWLAGLWTSAVTHYYLLSLPATLLGVLLGRVINHRLHGEAFLKYIYIGLAGIGALLLVQAVRLT